MTIKLYDKYPYNTEFEATVLSCEKKENDYDVILDQTLFFPEEGGQSCDKGTLNNLEVIDVQIKEGTIHHYLKQPLEGKVVGKIEWKHRYSNMQNHSGEHILSGLVHSLFGYNNVGFHLGNDEVTADYDGLFTNDEVELLEKKVNEAIANNITIHCWYPEDPSSIDYRSKKELNEAIRIVDVEGIDVCACCAPHVRSTAEVGELKILKAMKHRKGCRIYFLCGMRAFDHYQTVYKEAVKISNILSAPVDDISTSVTRLNKEVLSLKQQLSQLKKKIIDEQTKNLQEEESYIAFEEDIDVDTQKYYLNKLKTFAKDYAAIFVKQENNYRFLLVSNNDARIQLKLLKEHFNVRGGGKQDNIQGTIEATKEEILSILKGE